MWHRPQRLASLRQQTDIGTYVTALCPRGESHDRYAYDDEDYPRVLTDLDVKEPQAGGAIIGRLTARLFDITEWIAAQEEPEADECDAQHDCCEGVQRDPQRCSP